MHSKFSLTVKSDPNRTPGTGCCCVMQWMLPPPNRISLADVITTTFLSGKASVRIFSALNDRNSHVTQAH